MAAITPTLTSAPKAGGVVQRWSGTGTANQTDTLTGTAIGRGFVERLAYVTVRYSAAPTQAGVTVSLDSGLGSSFDATLHTGSANAQETVYLPDGNVYLLPDDAVLVSAPAGGGGITASIAIVTERL